MIEVPAKIWRPKVVSKYITPESYSDGVDSILGYAQYGNFVYKNNLTWHDDSSCTDIMKYSKGSDCAGLKKDLRFDNPITATTHSAISSIVKNSGIVLPR